MPATQKQMGVCPAPSYFFQGQIDQKWGLSGSPREMVRQTWSVVCQQFLHSLHKRLAISSVRVLVLGAGGGQRQQGWRVKAKAWPLA